MWLDAIRVFSILSVVMIHVSAYYVLNYSIASFEWLVGNSIDSLLRWCVPVFVMISGALLLDSSKDEPIFIFYRKRINKIITPLVFWSSFYAVWRLFRAYISTGSAEVSEVFFDVINGEGFYHLWFIFMILGVYAFTPFFRIVVKGIDQSEYTVLVFLLCILCISSSVFYQYNGYDRFFSLTSFLSFIPYFFLGHFIKNISWKPSKYLCLTVFSLSYLFTAFGCWYFSLNYGLQQGLSFYDYGTINVMFMSVSVFLFAKYYLPDFNQRKIITLCTPLVFGVYLIHPLFLDILRYKQIIVTNLSVFPSIAVLFLLVATFSLLSSYLFKKLPLLNRLI